MSGLRQGGSQVDPDLLAAYAATDYVIHVQPPVVARIDQRSLEVDALLAAWQVQNAAVITAWNPYSVPTSEVENIRAQEALVDVVEELGLTWLGAEGRGRDTQWPPEPSLCILDIPQVEAENLARRFRQSAFVRLELGQAAKLVVTT